MSKKIDTWFVCYGDTVIDTIKVVQPPKIACGEFYMELRNAYATVFNLTVDGISLRYKEEIIT